MNANYVHIFGYTNTAEVIGKTENGKKVSVYLPHEVIAKIAKYLTAENSHVGHAIWHSQNEDCKFPCSTCTPETGAAHG